MSPLTYLRRFGWADWRFSYLAVLTGTGSTTQKTLFAREVRIGNKRKIHWNPAPNRAHSATLAAVKYIGKCGGLAAG